MMIDPMTYITRYYTGGARTAMRFDAQTRSPRCRCCQMASAVNFAGGVGLCATCSAPRISSDGRGRRPAARGDSTSPAALARRLAAEKSLRRAKAWKPRTAPSPRAQVENARAWW